MTPADERVAARADLVDVEPYGAPQLDVAVRLNTNETADPPPPAFLDELARRLPSLQLNRYPDRPHRALRAALAGRHGLDEERVWAANGSNEVLLQLLQAYGGPDRRVLRFQPGYSMYPELCRTALTPAVSVDLDTSARLTREVARAAVQEHDPDLILIASPNNPVGSLVDHEVLRTLHDESRALVVVDEAYVEFAPAGSSVVPMLADHPRLVVVRTFSKAFRLAGLRLGYLVAAPWVVQDVQKVRLPYHLDAIKQLAALIALEQEERFLDHRQLVAAERDRIAARLAGLDEIEVFPSAANFLLLRSEVGDLFGRLLERGVLVRDFSSAPRLAGCVRVTVGTREENDAFLAALDDVLASARHPDPPTTAVPDPVPSRREDRP